ncbi:MAG: hypothetical protein A2X86_07135 [Bdellovibrionales bacterium GWA2_49_15]|nr:MAG: hypothetical protein A2X86_07135 [Bdellovibrionales bacterium GWA2_49_15]HAZ11950.1 hypothetical protein [Bdellovibrionales bacterium]
MMGTGHFLIIFTLAYSSISRAGEPAWWTQEKQKCGLPAGLAYNTWQSQGSPCHKGGGSSGVDITKGIFDSIEAARTAEKQRAAMEAQERAERERQQEIEDEARKQRLQSEMMDVEKSGELGLMMDSVGPAAEN